jgi:hypothetical protein
MVTLGGGAWLNRTGVNARAIAIDAMASRREAITGSRGSELDFKGESRSPEIPHCIEKSVDGPFS